MTKLKNIALVLALSQFFGFVATAQTHFTFTSITGNNGTVGILLNAPSIAGAPLVAGDEIGAFTPAGLCVGAVVWDGVSNVAVTVWEDDSQTPAVDGIKAGEVIKYRIWRQSTNTEFSDPSVTYAVGNGTYASGCVFQVSSLTVSAGTATKYLVTSSSSNPVAGSAVTITAQLADANSLPVATAGKTVTWSKTGVGGNFGSATSTTNSSGIATVVFTTGTVAGTVYAVTGTDNTSLTGTSANITTVADVASKYVATSSSYGPVAGANVTITAQLTDANNNPVATSGKTVTWSKTGAGGSFGSPTSTTNASGIATVTFTTGTTAGTVYTITGTDNTSLTGTSSNITTVPGVATKYLVTSSSYGPIAGSSVTITAQLSDANNNPVATSGKTVTWSKTGAGGSFASGTSTTNGSGVATVVFTTGTVAGTVYAVTGTDNTSLTGTSANITTVVGAAAKYVVTSSSYAPVAGADVTITAQLSDANNNPVSTSGKTVTWSSTNGGSFGSPTSATNASGTATVTFTTATAAGTVHAVTGTDNTSLTGTAPNVTTVAGVATKYVVASSNNSPVGGTAVTITAQLADANNNAVPTAGKTVTWTSTNGGSFGTSTSTTNASGIATVSFTTAAAVPTAHTVTATDNTSLTGTSANITTVAGPPTKYVVTSSSYSPVAGSGVTISAQLADAGGNPIKTAGKIVTWSKTGTGGSFGSPSSTTDANGVATVVFTTGTAAGIVYTVTGTDNTSLTGATANITTVAGTAAKYNVGANRYNPAAGDTVGIRAQLVDANNNPVATAGITVTWSKTGAGGSFGSATSTTDGSGVATVVFTTGTVAGTVHTVTGTDVTPLTGTSPNITTIAGPATKYVVTSSSYGPVAGSAVTITAQLSDVNNNPVSTSGKIVTWSKTGTGGSFASGTSTTNGSGVATVVFTTGTVAGTVYAVTGTDNTSLTGTAPNITTVVGAASKYVIGANRYNPVAGDTVGIVAQLTDANNNPVAAAGKTVTWSKTGAGGSFGSTTSTTDVNGVATVTFTTGTVSGTVYAVTGIDNTSLTGTAPNITTVPGAATKYLVTSSNNSPIFGTAVTITAQLSDVNNNAVPTAGKTVTWSSTNGGTFGTPTSTTNASGIATVSFTTATVVGTVHAVTATDNTSLTGTSANITTVAGPPTKYVVTSSSYSPVAGSGVTISAQLADAGGNPIKTAGKVVTWSKTGTGGSFGSPTSTTDGNGVATVVFTTDTVAGRVYTVTGTDNTSLTGTSSNITTVAGSATKYLVTSSSYGPVAGANVTIAAQLADMYGNAVATSGKTVTWSKTGAGGTFGSPASTTNGSGVATVVFTTGTVAGTVYAVTGTDNTSLTGTAPNITTVPGSATKYIVGANRYSPAAGDTVGIVAQLVDANNNPVATSGKTVTWSKTGAGGSFGSLMSATNGSGVATVVFTTGTVAGTVYAVTGTDNTSLTGTAPNITTVPGPATKYIVGANRYSPAAGDTVGIAAQLVDANNNPVATSGKTVTWSKTGTGGSFGIGTSTTNASGVATVTFTTGTVAGSVYAVTGTDNSSLTGTSPNITTVPGPATKYVVTSSSSTPVAGRPVTITAQLADANNNPVATSGKTVTWSSTNAGSFSSPTSPTNGSGVATVSFTTSNTVGTVHTVTATDNTSLTGTSGDITTQMYFTFTATTGNNATVGIPLSAGPTIAGSPLVAGDEIGAFDSTGLCVGAVVWDAAGNAALTVWGDNDQTGPVDGIKVGAKIKYRVWRQSTNTEYPNFLVTYSTDPSGNGTYVVNGVYVIGSMTPVGTIATKYIITSSGYSPIAGVNVTIRAQLSDAGNLPVTTAGKVVTWSKTGAGGSFASSTSTTDANGQATVVFTTSSVAGTIHTVTGTDNTSLTGTSSNITTVPGPAAKYIVGANRYSPVAGDTVGIRAQLADMNNNSVATAGIMVTWTKTGAGGSFGSPTSTTDANGVATVVFTTSTTAGTVYTVTGTDATPFTGATPNIATVPGAATKYLVTSSGYAPVAGAIVTITAQLADTNNNAVSTAGKTVTWTKTGAGGLFGSATSTTNASGVATVAFTTGTTAGTVYAVTGTDNTGLTGTAPSITTAVGVASKYVVGARRYNPVAGDTVGIVAQLTDTYGNAVSTSGKTLTWTKTGTRGSFGSATSTTDARGLATVVFTTDTVAGTVYTVTGTDNTSLTGTSANITTVPGAATKYLVTSSNYSPIFGTAVTITAQLSDVNNNAVPTAGKTVAWTSTNGGSFGSPTGTTNANGIATVSFTTRSVVGTVHTVTATDDTSLTGTSANITTVAGPPTKYILSVSRTSPVAGDTVTVWAQLTDVGDHPIKTSGKTVTWTKTGTGGSFAAATSTTDANGVATVVFTTATLAGVTYAVTGTDIAGLTGTSPTFLTIAGPPAQYLITASRYNPSAGDTVTVFAQLADANKNPAGSPPTLSSFRGNAIAGLPPARTVTWGKTGAGGSFSSPTSIADTSGLASVIFTTGPVAGIAYTFTATDNYSLTGTSPHIISPPRPPILLSPGDSAIVATPQTFSWSPSEGAVSYRLQISTHLDVSSPQIDQAVTDTTLIVPSLTEGTLYFWQVSAINAGGSTPSITRRFSTPEHPAPVVPPAPVLLMPADQALSVAIRPSLIWYHSAGAATYRLQVSSDSLFSLIVFDDSTTTATSMTVGPLAGGTWYYWRVQAKNSAGISPFSAVYRFTTVGAGPVAPTLISPADTAKAIALSPVLVWRAVAGAKTYRLQASTSALFTTTVFDDSTLTDTTKQVGPLGRDTTFFWRVNARNESGAGPYSAIRSFKTLPMVPLAPILVSPSDAAKEISVTPALAWRATAGAKSYWLQVAIDTSFAISVFSDSTLADTTKQIGPLGRDTTYFWRVNAKNEAGTGPYSAVRSFKTLPMVPLAPILVSPSDTAKGISVAPTLVWRASAGAKTYWLQVAIDSSFAISVFSDSTLADTTKQIGPLGKDATYYWRVSAKNIAGKSAFSAIRSFKTVTTMPLAPVLVSPLDGATGVSINPTLVWQTSRGAKSYWLEVSKDAAFTPLLFSDSTLVDTTKQVGPLGRDSKYFWRVSAANDGGRSPSAASRNFSTIVALVAAPLLVSPADAATGVALTPTLAWHPSSGAKNYRLQVSLGSSFDTFVLNDSTLVDTTAQVGPLLSDTTYYWRVSGKNDAGSGSFSATRSFRTSPQGPAQPTLATPATGAVGVATNPTLTWNAAASATSYGLQVSTTSTFATTVVNQTGISPSSYTVTGLANSTLYYWRVNATNAAGTSSWSSASTFTTVVSPPAAPTATTPANGATGVALNPALTWTASAGAVSYGCQVSTSSTFATTVIDQNGITGTSFTANGLTNGTLYYWRVNATNAGGTSGWTATSSFTTVVAAPAPPTLTAPANGAVGVTLSPVMTWTASPGAVSYTCQVSTNASFTTTAIDRSGLTGTSYVAPGLAGNTRYYWRMNATNQGGTSGWSAVFSFTTAAVSAVERYDSGVPTHYGLAQNYPNPFNPSTVIRFATPKSGDVTLKVYDLLGKEVAVLVSQQLQAGNFSVQWRADVPSGTYIYRIQAGDYVDAKKMTLLR